MGPPVVSFYYDYVDPASYVLDRVLNRPDLEGLVSLRYEPLELRPAEESLIDPADPAWEERWDVVQRACEHHAIEIVRPTIVPWSRKAHELGLHARERGCFEAVHPALFRAFFAGGTDIGRVDRLVTLAVEAGLDATETKAVLDVDRYAEDVVALRETALEKGIRGAPTLEAGDARLRGLPDREGLMSFLHTARST